MTLHAVVVFNFTLLLMPFDLGVDHKEDLFDRARCCFDDSFDVVGVDLKFEFFEDFFWVRIALQLRVFQLLNLAFLALTGG